MGDHEYKMIKPKKLKNESIDAYNERASKLYYSEGYHITEIAKKLKISRSYVSRIETAALQKLKRQF